MLPTQPLPGYRPDVRTPTRHKRLSRRQVRRMEGAGLWLAMLMLLFVQPLFEHTEASERLVAGTSGEFHYPGTQRRTPVPVLAADRTPVRSAGDIIGPPAGALPLVSRARGA